MPIKKKTHTHSHLCSIDRPNNLSMPERFVQTPWCWQVDKCPTTTNPTNRHREPNDRHDLNKNATVTYMKPTALFYFEKNQMFHHHQHHQIYTQNSRHKQKYNWRRHNAQNLMHYWKLAALIATITIIIWLLFCVCDRRVVASCKLKPSSTKKINLYTNLENAPVRRVSVVYN